MTTRTVSPSRTASASRNKAKEGARTAARSGPARVRQYHGDATTVYIRLALARSSAGAPRDTTPTSVRTAGRAEHRVRTSATRAAPRRRAGRLRAGAGDAGRRLRRAGRRARGAGRAASARARLCAHIRRPADRRRRHLAGAGDRLRPCPRATCLLASPRRTRPTAQSGDVSAGPARALRWRFRSHSRHNSGR